MRRAACLAAIALTVAATTPSLAQRIGSRIGRDAGPKDGMAALAIIADCVGSRHPAYVRRWMMSLPGTQEEQTILDQQQDGDLSLCMSSDKLVMDGKAIRFKARTLRAPVAMVLVRQQMRAWPTALPVTAKAEPWFESKLAAWPRGQEIDGMSISLLDFGHCVALAQWASVHDLLIAKEGSPEEQRAVKALAPVLGPCLTSDVQLTVTPDTLRKVLSEPVYHILQGDSLPAVS